MSGDRTYSYLWENHYKSVHGIIFVIDSTDKIRFALAADELNKILNHKDIVNRNVPILFFANKMDIKGACDA